MTYQNHTCYWRRGTTVLAAVAFVSLSVATLNLAAHEGHHEDQPPAKVAEEVAYRPTAIPDRIVLSWVDDPSTSQAVTWRTDTTVAKGVAQIALADDGPGFVSATKQLNAKTSILISDLGPAHYHEVNFRQLQPRTKYVYRVGDGTNWSEWIHFQTASAGADPFTFIYFGDAQNDIKSHWSRVVRQAFTDAPKASFMLHAGDLINQANRDADWGEWFYSGSFIHAMIPCVATPGNHEYYKLEDASGDTIQRKLSYHWQPTFSFPRNGPEGLEESAYWLEYQGATIISLNSNERLQEQVGWLENVLTGNRNQWVIVTCHHPIYSSKEGRDNPELRALWQPVFDKYKVDLVLQGHDHTYARSRLMGYENVAAGLTARSPEAGTMYVVSVSGPKMYELGRRPFMRRAAEDTQLYQIISVDGNELKYKACTATGTVYDAFTLRKRPGQVNELIERVPDTPERRRDEPLRAAQQKSPLADGLVPSEAAKAMTVPEGFEVSLIAGEPDVHQPIALAIDDRSRLWIAEAHTYPIRAADGQGRDKIVILEDADGDGSFETRKTFADGLNLVSGLEVGFGGVWVGAAPYLLFIPDRNGDDRPDAEPQVLLDGFGYEDTHETLNSFIWGPDGWLYGCHGIFTHSRVGRPGALDDQRTPMNAAYWRYHPIRHEFEVFAWGTSNSWGIDFDDHGQAFSTACVIPHLYHVIQGARYQRQAGQHFNPYVFDDIKTIAAHRHYAGDIRDHAWWGHEPVLPESTSEAGGGHAHCGAMVYLGDNWPDQFRNQLFMNNVHGNRVNMDRLQRGGSGYVGNRAPDFLFANDRWFRGISLKYGPDGGVYLIDWYDRNACHRTTPEIWDRTNGRVYKITYGSAPRPSTDAGGLDTLTDRQLVDLLRHRNDWYVRTARRILQRRAAERPLDEDARSALLEELRKEDADARIVLRAMWASHVTNGLGETEILQLLESSDEYVRAWAIQLELEDRAVSSSTHESLVSVAREDDSPLVRLHLASALQRLPIEQRWAIAEQLVQHSEDADDHNLPLMIWYGVEPMVLTDVPRAMRLAYSSKISLIGQYVVRRAAMVREGLASVIDAIGSEHEPANQRMLLHEVKVSLQGRANVPMPDPWSRVYSRLVTSSDAVVRDSAIGLAVRFGDKRTFPQLRRLASRRDQDAARRQWALDTLLDGNDAGAVPTLFALLDDPELSGPALRGLARFDHKKTAEVVLSRYHAFSDEQKRDAINTLSSRPSYSLALLNAVQSGDLPGRDIHAYVIRQIRRFDNPKINRKILSVWGNVRQMSADKQALIAEFRSRLTPDRLADADPMAGRGVFDKVCASCHKLFGAGDSIGPDLTGSNRANLDYVLENLLDPSAVVGNDYQLTIIETTDGRIVSGLVQQETDSAVTIRTINDTVVVAKEEIESRRQDVASMMPDNLLATLKEPELHDLIAYLASPTQVPSRGE